MAYDKEQIIQQALQVIEQENCTKIAEVLLFLPIAPATFYTWEVDEIDRVKQKIEEQKVRIKAKMKKKWFDSDVPALAIAAMKLLADDEEMEAINTSKVKQENTHQFKDLPTVNFVEASNSYQIK